MIEKLESKNGMYFYNVKSANGSVLVTSPLYYSKAARDNGITSLLKILTKLSNEE